MTESFSKHSRTTPSPPNSIFPEQTAMHCENRPQSGRWGVGCKTRIGCTVKQLPEKQSTGPGFAALATLADPAFRCSECNFVGIHERDHFPLLLNARINNLFG